MNNRSQTDENEHPTKESERFFSLLFITNDCSMFINRTHLEIQNQFYIRQNYHFNFEKIGFEKIQTLKSKLYLKWKFPKRNTCSFRIFQEVREKRKKQQGSDVQSVKTFLWYEALFISLSRMFMTQLGGCHKSFSVENINRFMFVCVFEWFSN